MITLDLPPKIEQAIYQQAVQAGLSVECYLQERIQSWVQPLDVAQFVQGKSLNSFTGDPVALQQEMRDE
jgi:hypothetical protein